MTPQRRRSLLVKASAPEALELIAAHIAARSTATPDRSRGAQLSGSVKGPKFRIARTPMVGGGRGSRKPSAIAGVVVAREYGALVSWRAALRPSLLLYLPITLVTIICIGALALQLGSLGTAWLSAAGVVMMCVGFGAVRGFRAMNAPDAYLVAQLETALAGVVLPRVNLDYPASGRR